MAGDAAAQVDLGCRIHGIGGRDSWIEGVKWFEMAAEQGYAEAWNQLAWCYIYDEGKRGSYENAIACYRKAVGAGDMESLFEIADVYEYMAESFEEILSKADWGIKPIIKMKIYKSYILALYWRRHAIDVKYRGIKLNLNEPNIEEEELETLYQKMLEWKVETLAPQVHPIERDDFVALQGKIKKWHYNAIEDDLY